jgi:hypothetical protein
VTGAFRQNRSAADLRAELDAIATASGYPVVT